MTKRPASRGNGRVRRGNGRAPPGHLFDCYLHEKKFHMVIEYCSGGELFDRITAKDHYSEREARVAFAQMVEAIGHCHQYEAGSPCGTRGGRSRRRRGYDLDGSSRGQSLRRGHGGSEVDGASSP